MSCGLNCGLYFSSRFPLTLRKELVGATGFEPVLPPCESAKSRYYNNLQDRGECLNTRKSYKN